MPLFFYHKSLIIFNFVENGIDIMRKSYLFILLLFLSFVSVSGRGYLGTSVRNYNQDNIQGARIINVFDDGAAKNAKLTENDIITSINKVPITSSADLIMYLGKYDWGDEIKIQFIRSGMPQEVSLNLGYKKDTKTYNLHKINSKDEQKWFFEDDNTVIVLDKDNQPISIQKNENNCITAIWYVKDNYTEAEMPQCFLDLEDKLFAIERIKKSQEERKVSADKIVYIKTISDEKTSTESNKSTTPSSLRLDAFSIQPNPSAGLFMIKLETDNTSPLTIKLFDVTGKIVMEETTGNVDKIFTKQYDLKSLAKGTYLLQIAQKEDRIAKKIIFQ